MACPNGAGAGAGVPKSEPLGAGAVDPNKEPDGAGAGVPNNEPDVDDPNKLVDGAGAGVPKPPGAGAGVPPKLNPPVAGAGAGVLPKENPVLPVLGAGAGPNENPPVDGAGAGVFPKEKPPPDDGAGEGAPNDRGAAVLVLGAGAPNVDEPKLNPDDMLSLLFFAISVEVSPGEAPVIAPRLSAGIAVPQELSFVTPHSQVSENSDPNARDWRWGDHHGRDHKNIHCWYKRPHEAYISSLTASQSKRLVENLKK